MDKIVIEYKISNEEGQDTRIYTANVARFIHRFNELNSSSYRLQENSLICGFQPDDFQNSQRTIHFTMIKSNAAPIS